jgi:peroxiredoxin
MESAPGASEYNRTTFTLQGGHGRDPSKADFQPALRVGMEAPDFPLLDLVSNTVSLKEFRGQKHIVLEFGCITAPVFINDLESLNRLNRQFQNEAVQFLIIYAREAHPGANYPAHISIEQKLAHARDLKRLEKIDIPVLVDSLEGRAHRAFGTQPSPVFVIHKDGSIAYKASWLVPAELELVVLELLKSDQLKAEGVRMSRVVYSESLLAVQTSYTVHERVFDRAGPGAREDVKKAFGVDPVELAKSQPKR